MEWRYHLDQRVQFLISPNCQLQVTGSDAFHLVKKNGINIPLSPNKDSAIDIVANWSHHHHTYVSIQ